MLDNTKPSSPVQNQLEASGVASPALASPEEKGITLFQALNLPENNSARSMLVRTSIIMAIVPLLVYMLCSSFFFASVSNGGYLTDNNSQLYSGIAAVIAVNIISFGYVIYAMFLDPENVEDDKEKKD